MNRRDLLLGSAAALAFGAAPRTQAQPRRASPTPEGVRLNALFDAIMKENLDRSPMSVSGLGLDKGERARQKSQLDDSSIAAWEGNKRRTADHLARLRGIDADALGLQERVNYDSVLYGITLGAQVERDISYIGDAYYGSPYVLSQLSGSYQRVPDFLDSQHAIETKADAEAYLSRLSAFATVLDQEAGKARHDVALGVIPPDFIIDKALIQMRALRDAPPGQAVLVRSLSRRAREKGLAGDWEQRAAALYTGKVQPALDRQIALMNEMRRHSVHAAGVARLPQGAAFYALALKQQTTSDVPPTEIHQTGLDLVRSQSAQADAILKAQGYTQGSVGERLRALFDDPKLRYPNTDAGKTKLIADLNAKAIEVQAKLPEWFGTLPKARLVIRRVPQAIEAGASGGYYESGSLDGTRPGAYYVNLRDTAELPSWVLPSITFHEGVPGHHLQLSLAQEADLPLIRKGGSFAGYTEGWALYAEQLAVEMGLYEHDPLGHVGQLHESLFRCVRLVVDTGLHSQGWSREQAIRYMVDALGDTEAAMASEVEKYCVWPGQASSYMLGKLDWLRLRQKAKDALGPRFDIRRFHDAGLLWGAMPLGVLDRRIEAYIKTA
ncbi:DUF885 family protein [Phenylobacterium sp.]|uniref:DUF885 domain-containing protein n=1 Tax=Phenylobacterium sp. TaxID=1871053 RepID=UPI0034580712